MKLKLILALLITLKTSAQVTFIAESNRDTIGYKEKLKVTFSVNKMAEDFNPPKFENFEVIGGPYQSMSNSWVDGKRTFNKTYSYFIEPIKYGYLTIASASIKIEGKIHKTLPLHIFVPTSLPEIEEPQNQNPLNTIVSLDGNKDVYFLEELNKNPSTLVILYSKFCPPCKNIYDDDWLEYIKNLEVDVYYIPVNQRNEEENLNYFNKTFKTLNSHIIIGKTDHIFKEISPDLKWPTVMAVKFDNSGYTTFGPLELNELKNNKTLFSKLNEIIE